MSHHKQEYLHPPNNTSFVKQFNLQSILTTPILPCCDCQAYKQHFAESPAAVLRDCLELVSDRKPISIDEVEPAAGIMSRFCTGGMSLGAISREVQLSSVHQHVACMIRV